ncbi:MAG: glycosyltransferase family 39 protein [Candidatus Gastranaerophilales bacterium]|nr:glycosyltransferase family 39 protein [Candidatus Gastranaerophilales bacterium]
MTKIIDKKYLFITLAGICFLLYLIRISSYVLVDFLDETKYAAVLSEMHGVKSLLVPYIDGKITFGAGIFYYFFVKISTLIFGRMGEFALRLPSVLCTFATLAAVFAFTKRMVNKKFAIIITLSLFANIAFLVSSSVSSPKLFSACFITIAVLSCCMPAFIERFERKPYYYFSFWFFSLLAALSGEISCFMLPFVIVFPVLIICNKFREFIEPKNIFPGLLTYVLCLSLYFFAGYKLFSYDFLYFIGASSAPQIFCGNMEEKLLHIIKNDGLFLVLGGLPWILSFLTIFASLFVKIFREIFIHKTPIKQITFDEGRKFFLISIWAIVCSLCYAFIWHKDSFDIFLTFFFFMSFTSGYYWYRNIDSDAHKKAVFIPSLLFYIMLVLATVVLTASYFFVTPLQKEYVEPLIIPIMVITLFVSVPGLIAVVLKRKVLNFSMHITFSILFFFFLTGLLYNYVSSFGENDLINFAEKAKQDNAMLATYNVRNKYSMIYYYAAPVIFNGEMDFEQVYDNYGDTRNVYLVLKHSDLAYMDRFFVYEVVSTGKVYCEITNIKYLPKDEIKEDKDINN